VNGNTASVLLFPFSDTPGLLLSMRHTSHLSDLLENVDAGIRGTGEQSRVAVYADDRFRFRKQLFQHSTFRFPVRDHDTK